jgi:benzoylformate decarboxylase
MALGENEAIDYRLALHEDIAVGMAAGYARNRRYRFHDDPEINPVGVVNLHITPGVGHGLGNLYAADISNTPLVVTAGNNSLDHRHHEPALSGNLLEMVDQFTKWNAEVLDVDSLPTMLRRAFRVAMTPPTGPVFLSLPLDVMSEPEPLGPIPSAGRGDPTQVTRASERLIESEQPVFVVGDAIARTGTDAIEAAVDLAEATGARVYAEMLASEVNFPSAHEQFISFLPLDADVAKEALDTDLVAFIGVSTNMPLTSFEGTLVDRDTTCLYISDDSREIGKNHPVDAGIIGDPGTIMKELTTLVEAEIPAETREKRLNDLPDKQSSTSSESTSTESLTKVELANSLYDVVPEAYLVDEAITASWALKLYSDWEFKPEHYQLNKGAGLGYGLPAAVGAAIAEQERDTPRPVVGYVGDGSSLYYPQSLYSAARYDVDLTIVIPDNRSYEVLKSNVVGMFGGERSDYTFTGMDFDPAIDFEKNAASQGVSAAIVQNRDQFESELEQSIESNGTTLLDVQISE